MGLFGKKKEEEYEDEDELIEAEKEDRKLTRKFKDLNSENKKKRKEPPKPWGKKERLLVLSILVITVVLSGILALTARGFNFPNFSKVKISFPKFNFENIFGEETIVIGKKVE